MDTDMKIGDKIKNLRKENKMTQEQLARKCNLSKNAIWNYENHRRAPTLNVVNKIAEALNVDITYLINYDSEKVIADTFFDGNIDDALYYQINGSKIKYITEELIKKYSNTSELTADPRLYFDLIFYIARQNLFSNARKCYDFFESISKEEFQEIQEAVKAIVVGKISILKAKKEGK